ncbi:5-hydroxytryptamine receptor 2A-like [Dreissena polymorpha]|uniref:G-protein coupled receptors family 1 profile domain-containing protein n=1 Tax=Dreissena polymorpha TaxID=45954 RepID=A0A9D4G9P4_DREPO|nr:5-hydroxytryptamine receptor 2A-like [Dreissena polymorpha]XP_052217666.1 5-hydroxytryptamine receptor 2A-like [Dreissena polymorpha]XP_052217667.1 5-hydroxytryptamine receptor 2A-like [Dreissena polymorpha]XP_052217668.1 5-hydroxytryptamine receptor 2A-like [Dreissena polymorpha]KAH3812993.1 hypothetical protein DPMN_141439 [Dreissena polymorpha]
MDNGTLGAINDTGVEDVDNKNNWLVLLLIPLIMFGVAGNILVCMAITMEKRLQSVTNYFLLSLAITDLLVCLVVWPLSLMTEFLGHWPFEKIFCDIYVTLDVLMCTCSILHLCTISLERFLAIRDPLATRSRSKLAVRIKIVLVYVVALAISSPIMILGIIDEHNILNNNKCMLVNEPFIIYGSVSAFYIPLTIMGLIFGMTLRLLRKQHKLCNAKERKDGEVLIRRLQSTSSNFQKTWKKVHKERQQRGSSSSSSEQNSPSRHDTTNRSILTDSSLMDSPKCEDSPFSVFNRSDTSEYRLPLGEIHEHTIPIDEAPSDERMQHYSADTIYSSLPDIYQHSQATSGPIEQTFSDLNDNEAMKITKTVSAPSELHSIKNSPASGSLSAQQNVKKDSVKQKQANSSVKTEQKASKTLGIVFLSFVICWLPFFIVNIMTVLCRSCDFRHVLLVTVLYLGYVSSTLNPIIYTVFNRTFRATMFQLMKCQCRAIQRPKRIKAICVGLNYAIQHDRNRDHFQMPL